MFLHEVKVSAKGRNEARIVSAFGASIQLDEVMSHNRPGGERIITSAKSCKIRRVWLVVDQRPCLRTVLADQIR